MHSLLVGTVFVAMVLAPCVVALLADIDFLEKTQQISTSSGLASGTLRDP